MSRADDSWRDQLGLLRERADAVTAPKREWRAIAGEAHATVLAAAQLTAVGSARADHPVAGRDALALGIDAVTNYQGDPLRDELVAALERVSPDVYGNADLDEIVDRLNAMSDAQLDGLMNATQGSMLELQVEELLTSEALSWPEGAARFELADRNDAGVDGWFVDEQGEVMGQFQVKASETLDPAREHLGDYPGVDVIYADSHSASLADDAGLGQIRDTGVTHDQLLPTGADGQQSFVDAFSTSTAEGAIEVASALPLVTGALIGAELAWAKFRGEDMTAARHQATSRAVSSGVLWTVGSVTSAATGIGAAQFTIAVGGKTGQWALDRMTRELAPSMERLNQLRQVVAATREGASTTR